jgi:hypothetical protein
LRARYIAYVVGGIYLSGLTCIVAYSTERTPVGSSGGAASVADSAATVHCCVVDLIT